DERRGGVAWGANRRRQRTIQDQLSCAGYIIFIVQNSGDFLAITKTNSVPAAPGFAAKEYLSAVQEVLERVDHAVIDQMVEAIWRGYQAGKTPFLFGNGGRAALAGHFSYAIWQRTASGVARAGR